MPVLQHKRVTTRAATAASVFRRSCRVCSGFGAFAFAFALLRLAAALTVTVAAALIAFRELDAESILQCFLALGSSEAHARRIQIHCEETQSCEYSGDLAGKTKRQQFA